MFARAADLNKLDPVGDLVPHVCILVLVIPLNAQGGLKGWKCLGSSAARKASRNRRKEQNQRPLPSCRRRLWRSLRLRTAYMTEGRGCPPCPRQQAPSACPRTASGSPVQSDPSTGWARGSCATPRSRLLSSPEGRPAPGTGSAGGRKPRNRRRRVSSGQISRPGTRRGSDLMADVGKAVLDQVHRQLVELVKVIA